MNAIEWLDQQVNMCEQQIQYQKLSEDIYLQFEETRIIFVKGVEILAKEIGQVVRRGYEDEDEYNIFFEYKGIKFMEVKEKDGDGK